jgi:hypothetical protein
LLLTPFIKLLFKVRDHATVFFLVFSWLILSLSPDQQTAAAVLT